MTMAAATFFDGFVVKKWRPSPFFYGFATKKVTTAMSSRSSMMVDFFFYFVIAYGVVP
jgi:hypothetical protein